MKETIYFSKADSNSDEMSILNCIKMTWYWLALSVKKVSRVVDDIVHEYAWLTVFAVAVLAFLLSSVFIHSARAERDVSQQKQYKLEQQVQSLQCQLEITNK